jgi:hypothetical protein
VAVTDHATIRRHALQRRPVRSQVLRAFLGAVVILRALPGFAAVLPEDRADILYHSYSGDNVTIEGPSVLVRKGIADKFSVSGNYYVDSVSSASIDVVTTGASPYTEERTQTSVGLDFLRGDTIMGFSVTQSTENDYEAENLNIGISQDIFGGLTTVSLGYAIGSDIVRRNGDDQFEDTLDRQNYRLGISQVLTRNLLVGLNFETVTDEGFLNNPYRVVRFRDPGSASGYSFQPEVYPRTRTSNAVAVRGRYFLPYRAVVHAGYRYFIDDWDIEAHTVEVGYMHPMGATTFELQYRFYTQTQAEFFSDLFPYRDAQNFLARDKEMSTFTSNTLRFGVSYDFLEGGWKFLDKGSLNLIYDYILFDYENFRDLRVEGLPPGEEPLFNFDADVIQLFVSFWF